METTQIDPAAAAAALGAPKPATELGREDFMKLLVAQLENQDPLSPQGDTEFIAQLATFSSLEQLISVNDQLETLGSGQASLINAQALNLIGKNAVVESADAVRILEGRPDGLIVALPEDVSRATLTIYDSSNNPVRSITLDAVPGTQDVTAWDGTDDAGDPLPDGDYRVELSVLDAAQAPLDAVLFRSVHVDGVTFVDGGIGLFSGGLSLPFESILEFRAD